MAEVTVRMDVAADQEQVFAALTNWRRQGEWMLATTVGVTGGDGRSVGSTLDAVTGAGLLAVTDSMEITAWEPPLRCRVRHTGSVVRGEGEFAVHGQGEHSSVVSWAEHLELPFGQVTEWGWPLVRPVFALGVWYSLRRFATFAEGYVS